jgi:hypothetical protein
VKFREDEISSRIVLSNGTVFSKCDLCRQTYGERNPPEEPPCDTCRVDLMEENREAAEIFFITRNQVIVAFDRVIDINHLAVDAAMQRNNVSNKKDVFVKVIRAFHETRKDKGG